MTPALRAKVLNEWQPSFGDANAHAQRSASSANQLVPLVMKQLGLEERLQQSQVFYLWPTIVGSDIARHAQPVSLRNGLLVVSCDHPMWLQEITRYSKPLILQKVQERLGKKVVRDISFRIG
jgi:predicted nucleic acid-binding Zn ribbon protein